MTPGNDLWETYRPATDDHLREVEQVEEALLDPGVGHIVEMVLSDDRSVEGRDHYRASSIDGSVGFHRRLDGHGWHFVVDEVVGLNPLENQSVTQFSPLADEKANPYPDRAANSYPGGYEQVAQLFDSPAAPDLIAVHSSSHNWEDQGGHLGEHGSISIIQARTPFIVAGAGIRAEGMVADSCKLVDLAPTVLSLMGAEPCGGIGLNGLERDDAHLARQDGEVLTRVIDERAPSPRHVVGILLDGANANVLYELASSGAAPNVERLMKLGTSFEYGAMSSLPTVTLANHTTILTGAHPGHHGILHNAWFDRGEGRQVITNSPQHWISAMDWLSEDVESLFSAVKRAFPGSTVISVNEPCDAGADYSIFDVMRRGEMIDAPPPVEELPHTDQRFVRPHKEYRWSSLIDHTGVEQFCGIWSGRYHDREWSPPRFSWVNFSLTDSAFHEGGPYSEIAAASVADTDARIGEVLDAVRRAGVEDDTAFFITADHGMEETDRNCTGNWAEALDDAGVTYRDEGYGFIYANP